MSARNRQILIKLVAFWGLFLALHFSYSWFPSPAVAVFSGINESFLQHAKIGFIAYSLVSLGEILIVGKRQASLRSFVNARAMTSLVQPWVMFVIWYVAPAFYGRPMPTVAVEIVYANIALLLMAAILALVEVDLEKLRLSPWKERALWLLWGLSLAEMIIFTFRLPWADFFRG